MCCTRILCFMGWHKFQPTDWVSRPYMISRHKKVRYHLLQCKRCCEIKNGEQFDGRIVKGKSCGAKPLKICKF